MDEEEAENDDTAVEETEEEREERLAKELEEANTKAKSDFKNKFDVSADYDAYELEAWLDGQPGRYDMTDE